MAAARTPRSRSSPRPASSALRLVGAGRFEPGDGRWLPSALDPDEDERVRRLAAEASYDAWSPSAAESAVRDLVAAVVDALPRGTPGALTSTFRRRLDAELVRPRPTGRGGAGLPALVTISLRVEADEEELVAGSVRLVLQVHDELDPLHLCDAALLWTGTSEDHGFGDRARTHAAIALRAAAHAWPVLDRLLELRVPDEITLDTDELVSLLDDGVAALRRVGVDVLWPRSLGRDLTTRAALEHRDERAQEGPLMTGLFGPDAMFAFKWQVALHGEPLSDAEMRQLATAASPVLKLRGAWTVVDPAGRPQGQEAADPHHHPGAGGRGRAHGHGRGRGGRGGGHRRGQPAEGPRAPPRRRHPRPTRRARGAAGDAARLPAARADLARPADHARARLLPGRRHGPRQDHHR